MQTTLNLLGFLAVEMKYGYFRCFYERKLFWSQQVQFYHEKNRERENRLDVPVLEGPTEPTSSC